MCSAVLTIMPDPLLMNAFNNINLAAACILTSVDFARELGVPEEKWIYPLGGAGTRDSDECEATAVAQLAQTDKVQSGNAQTSPQAHPSHALSTQRYKFPIQAKTKSTSSISTRRHSSFLEAYRTQLTLQRCFPIVPKLAQHHLSLPATTPLTLLGGLTSFGGAGNNYSMHALTEMTRQLRQRKNNAGFDGKGLILANGGVLTYQHVVILSSSPREDNSPYPSVNPLSVHPRKDVAPSIEEEAKGAAVIEVCLPELRNDVLRC
jgi:hypothetical protein